jgi:hypothetical protein
VLFSEPEANLFVEVPGGIKTLETPEVYPLVAFVSTKVDSGIDELMSHASSAQGVGQDEPPKVRPLLFGMDAVDGHRAFNATSPQRGPEAVAAFVLSAEER